MTNYYEDEDMIAARQTSNWRRFFLFVVATIPVAASGVLLYSFIRTYVAPPKIAVGSAITVATREPIAREPAFTPLPSREEIQTASIPASPQKPANTSSPSAASPLAPAPAQETVIAPPPAAPPPALILPQVANTAPPPAAPFFPTATIVIPTPAPPPSVPAFPPTAMTAPMPQAQIPLPERQPEMLAQLPAPRMQSAPLTQPAQQTQAENSVSTMTSAEIVETRTALLAKIPLPTRRPRLDVAGLPIVPLPPSRPAASVSETPSNIFTPAPYGREQIDRIF